jgi:asparagine synthase (glutamine-hydrolysing)
MFAIALHDSARRKLILVRDHIGVKPLFYYFDSDYLIWGSEIKALLATRLIKRNTDLDALGEFLAWGYVPGQGTLFKTIKKLEPGHLIEINLDNPLCTPRSYWDIPFNEPISAKEQKNWEEEIDHKIQECVQRQMVSDVPLGAFLSGGVDSSLLVASLGNAKTFSIGSDDPSFNELKWARKVARHLNVNLEYEIIKPNILEIFDHLMYFMDDPIGDFSIFPTYLVASLARKHVKVALSGDGGDELFGGYMTYLADQKEKQYSCLPRFMRKKLIEPLIKQFKPRPTKKGLINKALIFTEGLEHPDGLAHARWRYFVGELLRQELFTEDVLRSMKRPASSHILHLFEKAGARGAVNRNLYVDLKSYLCDNCLVKTDRMSMAVSLEARVPLLDKELVESAFCVPANLKVSKGKTKILLKRIAAKYAPADCVYRPKEGFSMPVKNWLNTSLRPLLDESLNRNRIKQDGLFRPSTIERLKQEHWNGTANHSHILWSLIVFHKWRQMWLKEPCQAV